MSKLERSSTSNKFYIILLVSFLTSFNSVNGVWNWNRIADYRVGKSREQNADNNILAQKYIRPLCENIDPNLRDWYDNEYATPLPRCSRPSHELPLGRAEPGSIERTSTLPKWANLTLAHKGQEFAMKNMFPITQAAIFGLINVLTLPDIAEVLIFSNNSDTPVKVVRRYLATGIHYIVWIHEPVPNHNQKYSPFLTSINNIRRLHQVGADKLNKFGFPLEYTGRFQGISLDQELWDAFTLDLLESPIPEKYRRFPKHYHTFDHSRKPINQFAQTLTLFGFAGYLFLDTNAVGAYGASSEDVRAFQHLWAIIGHGIGIDDQYNVFLQPDLKLLKKHLEEIKNEYYVPSLFNLNHETKVMVEALVDGYSKLIPGYGNRPLLLRLLRDQIKIPVPRMNAILTPKERTAFRRIKQLSLSARDPAFRELVSKWIVKAGNGLTAAFFGPYFTNRERAERVIYDTTLRG